MWNQALVFARKHAGASLVAIAAVFPATASAMPAISLYPLVSPITASVELSIGCADTGTRSLSAPAPVTQQVSHSKSAAILGGEMSALERMKAQQSGVAQEPVALAGPVEPKKLEPAAAGIRIDPKPCPAIYSAVERASPALPSPQGNPEDFLASKRVQIDKTSFDKDWRRVRSERIAQSSRPNAILATGETMATVKGVNEWVNRNITYVEDRDLFGRADYWAGARKTLRMKKGDCEDIALTKLQLLAAAGFSRDDMFITIARDTIRRADHALLVVKLDGRYVVLDNATDVVLDGTSSHGYAPVLSFAANKSWIHGY